MHTIGTNHTRIAGKCVKTRLARHSCFLVGANSSWKKDMETTGAALTFSQRGVSISIPSLLSAFLRGSPAFQSSSVFYLQERGNLSATKQSSMWCSFSFDTSYHCHIYESVQLHLPHLLCNALAWWPLLLLNQLKRFWVGRSGLDWAVVPCCAARVCIIDGYPDGPGTSVVPYQ